MKRHDSFKFLSLDSNQIEVSILLQHSSAHFILRNYLKIPLIFKFASSFAKEHYKQKLEHSLDLRMCY